MATKVFRRRNNRETAFVTNRAMHKGVCRPFFLRRRNETLPFRRHRCRRRGSPHRILVWLHLWYNNHNKVGMAMKTTLTKFEISSLKTPAGNQIPVKGKTVEVTRFEVEIFREGNVSRLLFWLKDGSSEAIILNGPIVHGIAPASPVDVSEKTKDATKRKDI